MPSSPAALQTYLSPVAPLTCRPARALLPPSPAALQTYLSEHGVEWQEVYDLKEVASLVDVLYMTRIQKERFTCMEEYAKA